MKKINSLFKLIGFALIVAAVVQELRKPPEEREWHGKVAGFVPYDFRFPTLERIRNAYWNPDNPNVFTDRVLGVGWGVNIPVAASKLRDLTQDAADQAKSVMSQER